MTLTSLTDEIAGYVEAGAALLDAEHPGWRDRIDVGALDQGRSDRDVYGQLGLDVDADSRRLADVQLSPTSWRLWRIRHGHDCPWFDEDGGRLTERDYFDMLTEAWVNEIESSG